MKATAKAKPKNRKITPLPASSNPPETAEDSESSVPSPSTSSGKKSFAKRKKTTISASSIAPVTPKHVSASSKKSSGPQKPVSPSSKPPVTAKHVSSSSKPPGSTENGEGSVPSTRDLPKPKPKRSKKKSSAHSGSSKNPGSAENSKDSGVLSTPKSKPKGRFKESSSSTLSPSSKPAGRSPEPKRTLRSSSRKAKKKKASKKRTKEDGPGVEDSAVSDSDARLSSFKPHELRLSEVPPLYEDYESEGRDSEPQLPQSAREQWDSQIEYILVLVSTAVGLGNVWKFPFAAYNNGGGAFIIPYLIIVILVAVPMFFVELTVSQFCSRGPLGIWDCVPIMRGIGWSVFLISTMLSFFYLVILSWCAMYLFFSFYPKLPWNICDVRMYTSGGLFKVHTAAREFINLRCENESVVFIFDPYHNKSHLATTSTKTPTTTTTTTTNPTTNSTRSPTTSARPDNNDSKMTPERAFFEFYVLKSDADLDHGGGLIGWPQFELSVALAILWFIVFLSMMFGTKSSGKVAYFTALFPYAVLIILFVRAVTLPGAVDGIKLFLSPDFHQVIKPKVWFAAMNQAFFSLGIGFGNAAVAGSYSPLHQKTYFNALIIGAADTFTSVMAGLTVFSILGVLAKIQNVELAALPDSFLGGPGLAFVVYPMLMKYFGDPPAPQLFSMLFFAMLLALGIGSAVGFLQVFQATMVDKIPVLGLKRGYKIGLVACWTGVSFVVGLVFCCPGSEHVMNMFDAYGCGFVIFFLVMLEIAAWAYIYGIKNLEMDFLFMFPHFNRTDCKWLVLRYWAYGMPVFFLGLFTYTAAGLDMVEETKAHGFVAPLYLQVAGWSLFGLLVGMVPAYGIYVVFTRKTRSFRKKWMASITPNRYWGPKEPEEKAAWVEFKKNYGGFAVRNSVAPGIRDKNENQPEQPSEKPTEKPTENPTENPTERPTETPLEKPPQKQPRTKTKKSSEKHTENISEKPPQKSLEKPTKA